MSISYVNFGSRAYGTAPAPALPSGMTEGDLMLLVVGWKSVAATVTDPSGWTKLSSASGTGGTGSTGVDTGPMAVAVYWKTATATETLGGTVPLSTTDMNVAGAVIVAFTGATTWDLAGGLGDDTSGGTDFTAAATLDGDVRASDVLMAAGIIPTDVSTPAQFSGESFSASGLTIGTAVEITELDTSSGGDMGGVLWYAAVTAGSTGGTPTVTASATAGGTTTNVYGPIAVVRVGEPRPAPAFVGWGVPV